MLVIIGTLILTSHEGKIKFARLVFNFLVIRLDLFDCYDTSHIFLYLFHVFVKIGLTMLRFVYSFDNSNKIMLEFTRKTTKEISMNIVGCAETLRGSIRMRLDQKFDLIKYCTPEIICSTTKF